MKNVIEKIDIEEVESELIDYLIEKYEAKSCNNFFDFLDDVLKIYDNEDENNIKGLIEHIEIIEDTNMNIITRYFFVK